MKIWQRLREKISTTIVWTIVAAFVGAGIASYLSKQYEASMPQPAQNPHDIVTNFAVIGFPLPMVISVTLWLIFSIYWETAARHADATTDSESRSSRRLHLLILNLAQLILFVPIPGLRARFLPNQISLAILGLSAQLGFLIWTVWARRSLGQNWSGAIATTVNQQFVRSGPYRFVRHPIYAGVLGMYLSTGLVSGEIHALVGILLAVIAYWRKIRLEEKHLHALFGSAYEEYCKATRALIPGII